MGGDGDFMELDRSTIDILSLKDGSGAVESFVLSFFAMHIPSPRNILPFPCSTSTSRVCTDAVVSCLASPPNSAGLIFCDGVCACLMCSFAVLFLIFVSPGLEEVAKPEEETIPCGLTLVTFVPSFASSRQFVLFSFRWSFKPCISAALLCLIISVLHVFSSLPVRVGISFERTGMDGIKVEGDTAICPSVGIVGLFRLSMLCWALVLARPNFRPSFDCLGFDRGETCGSVSGAGELLMIECTTESTDFVLRTGGNGNFIDLDFSIIDILSFKDGSGASFVAVQDFLSSDDVVALSASGPSRSFFVEIISLNLFVEITSSILPLFRELGIDIVAIDLARILNGIFLLGPDVLGGENALSNKYFPSLIESDAPSSESACR
mmetsp:Transcript_37627/g.78827  ORF Transcript_37627/g.78827 Transcript_37627/m.78827 type:complete len:379 (-) Transcript_37627:1691-2827(-)